MNQTAVQGVRPWEQPFWKPAPGQAGILFYLVVIHALAVIGLILFPLPSWKTLGLAILLAGFGGLGTTVCYHRALAHHTVKLNKFMEQLLVFGAICNGTGDPASWVAYHRHHHSHTDTPPNFSCMEGGIGKIRRKLAGGVS